MDKPTLAIIVPCFNEELCVKSTIEKLLILLNSLVDKNKIKNDSYLYLVDDGSVDNTWNIIEDAHKKDKRVQYQLMLICSKTKMLLNFLLMSI